MHGVSWPVTGLMLSLSGSFSARQVCLLPDTGMYTCLAGCKADCECWEIISHACIAAGTLLSQGFVQAVIGSGLSYAILRTGKPNLDAEGTELGQLALGAQGSRPQQAAISPDQVSCAQGRLASCSLNITLPSAR